MSFRMAFFMCISVGRFRCRFVFLFLGRRACVYVKSFFRFLVRVARKFCGHWKIAFSRMISRSAESDFGKCRMEAKNVLFTWFFVNVWLPFAGNIRFLQR